MPVHQLLAGAATKAPNSVAVRHLGHEATWSELYERVGKRASKLRSSGLQDGDRVAILSANVPECMEAQFGLLLADLVLVPLNTRLSLAEQTYILEHCACKRLLYDERNHSQAVALESAVAQLQVELLTPITQWDTEHDPLKAFSALSFVPCDANKTAAIFYTGGTTGRPKGVELTHLSLLIQGMSAKDNYDLDETTVFMHSAPMFHLADFAASLGSTAALSTHCFLPEYSPDAVLDSIENEDTNVVIMVPTMITGVLEAARTRKDLFKRLRKVLYGAAPIQEPLLLQLMREAPGVKLVQVYGQSEVGGACSVLTPDRHVLQGPLAGKTGSAGRVIPAFNVRIVGDEGEVLPVGKTGEIQLCGPGLMRSYWNDPAQTQAAFVDGWLRTGDLGYLDEEGFLTISGRLKDMIISGGENIFAGEVESTLMYHEAVEAVAVIGVPDSKWGETVHAVVYLKSGAMATEDELIGFCRQRIAHYKAPRSITIRDDPLPLSGVGKVRKVDLINEWKSKNA